MNIYYVPKIDHLAGIRCYCTDYEGISGCIKQNDTSFRVSEIIDDSFLIDLSPVQNDTHKFPLYILDKRNIDSNHALFEIKRDLGIRLKILGIKDSRAITKQYASSEQTGNVRREAKTRHTLLILKGFTRKPLRKAHLSGNEFTITVNNTKSFDISDFIPQIRNIANFYGLQRFGSKRLITHLVGREIVKRNFKKAIELLLSHTSEYDSPRTREIREKCRDPKNYSQILKQLPKGMDIEYAVMYALANGREPVAALRSIPIVIRRLFVQAYQAYIFNNCVSVAILDGEDISVCKEGDLCFELEGQLIFGKIRKYDSHKDLTSDVVPAVRLSGYTFQPNKGRFEIITRRLMHEETITEKDFYIKEMEELSAPGGFRQVLLWCKDFSYMNSLSLTLHFKLPKGSYATTLLRELMKPKDPIRSGF